ncbi:DUF3311 domain-containing protein [Microbacteriaceae bacterium K1510]|nr:DUF3311 domain-containing protein [Microbacteriaceae bacterium K1510]
MSTAGGASRARAARRTIKRNDTAAIDSQRNVTFSRGATMDQNSERRPAWSWWYLLFLIQFIAVLWPPFYNRLEPSWAGIPFFYWYQLLWVIIGAMLTAIVYFATERSA